MCKTGNPKCLDSSCANKCCESNYAYTQEGGSYKQKMSVMSSTRQYMAYAGSALLGAAIVGAVVLVHGRVSRNPYDNDCVSK